MPHMGQAVSGYSGDSRPSPAILLICYGPIMGLFDRDCQYTLCQDAWRRTRRPVSARTRALRRESMEKTSGANTKDPALPSGKQDVSLSVNRPTRSDRTPPGPPGPGGTHRVHIATSEATQSGIIRTDEALPPLTRRLGSERSERVACGLSAADWLDAARASRGSRARIARGGRNRRSGNSRDRGRRHRGRGSQGGAAVGRCGLR